MPETTTKAPVPEYTYDAYHTNKSRYAKRKEAMAKIRREVVINWWSPFSINRSEQRTSSGERFRECRNACEQNPEMRA